MRRIYRLVDKYSYIFMMLILTLIFVILHYFTDILELINCDLSETLIGSAFTMLGFLITALTIFISADKNTKFMSLIIKIGHRNIFYSTIILALAFNLLTIIFGIFDANIKLLSYFTLMGLGQILIIIKYSIQISLYNVSS